MYNKLRLAKEIQLNLWTHVCIQAATLAGGRLQGGGDDPDPLGGLAERRPGFRAQFRRERLTARWRSGWAAR